MADQGWYPDPHGEPGRYRYYDGTTWSERTSGDPSVPPPSRDSSAEAPPASIGRRLPVRLLVLAVLGVLVVLAVVAVRQLVGTPAATPRPNTVASPADGGSRTTAPGRTMDCGAGEPGERDPHPQPRGVVHGGNLSFPAEPTFAPPAVEPRLSFAYDVNQQFQVVNRHLGWIAQLAVGRLRGTDFPGSAQQTAQDVTGCILRSSMYQPYGPRRHDVRGVAVTVTGTEGWLIETAVAVRTFGLHFPGDRVVVVVVRNGSDWGMFFGAVPIGDHHRNAILDRTVAALRTG